MADDFVLNIRQIGNYPQKPVPVISDAFLLQSNGLGGAYMWSSPSSIVAFGLAGGGFVNFSTTAAGGLAWGNATLTFAGGAFQFSQMLQVPSLSVVGPLTAGGNISTGGTVTTGAGQVATQDELNFAISAVVANSVTSFNGRTGAVLLEEFDVLRAGGAPVLDAHFGGFCTAPTQWDVRSSSDQIATTEFVHTAIHHYFDFNVVSSFNGRNGCVILTTDDVNQAYENGGTPTASNPAPYDTSNRIATTIWVSDAMDELRAWVVNEIATVDLTAYAKLDSPQFTGNPTGTTAAPGNSTRQLATTAFVEAAVTASTTGVSSFNTRTGAVVLTAADVSGVGGALLASPIFTGNPTAPTATAGSNSDQLATTAFVHDAVAAISVGVTSFNTRTGAVVLQLADVTGVGGAPSASPALTGTPTAPTATAGTNTGQLATTAFVTTAISAMAPGVSSFNGRTGTVTLIAADISAAGGAVLAGPAFTGIPTAPTAAPGTSTAQIATTAFVTAAIGGVVGVTSFNGRTGGVTLTLSDITVAGGAPLASPAFTGSPTAPTAPPGTNTTDLATTAFVSAALAAQLVSPAFTGTPTAPTAAQTVNNTQLATTAYVRAAIGAIGAAGVTSFNTRTGAVTFQVADLSAVGGALLAGPAFTGVPTAPTAAPTTNNTQLATTAFVQAAIAGGSVVSSFNTRTGAVVLTAADITAAGGALLASPAFTGTPTAPTAAPGTNTTQIATTAFVAASGAGTVTSGNRVLIQRIVVSTAVAYVTFSTGIDATYDEYELHCIDTAPSAEAYMYLQFSYDGVNWPAQASDFFYAWDYVTAAGTAGPAGGSFSAIPLGTNHGVAQTTNHTWIKIPSPAVSGRMHYIAWEAAAHYSAYAWYGRGMGGFVPAAPAPQTFPPVTAIRVAYNSPSQVSRGTFSLFGIKK